MLALRKAAGNGVASYSAQLEKFLPRAIVLNLLTRHTSLPILQHFDVTGADRKKIGGHVTEFTEAP